MLTVFNINEQLAGITQVENRSEHSSDEDMEAAFATLGKGDFHNASVYLGSFSGSCGWERHAMGEELVQIVTGSTRFDIIIDDKIQTHELSDGTLFIIPRGCWHRFQSVSGVTLLTATPQGDEETTFADDPRRGHLRKGAKNHSKGVPNEPL